jgi:hypothetical protein
MTTAKQEVGECWTGTLQDIGKNDKRKQKIYWTGEKQNIGQKDDRIVDRGRQDGKCSKCAFFV